MIEEAAGTRMYESKKQQAIKTMEKKQSKLGEIENVIIWTCLEFVPTKFSNCLNRKQFFFCKTEEQFYQRIEMRKFTN